MDCWTSVRGSAERFRALDARERHTALRALLLLPVTAVALRLLGFRRLHAGVERALPSATEPASPTSRAQALAVTRLVRAVARRLPGSPSCLTTSLVCFALLRARGIASALRFGVRLRAGDLEAHAWLEVRGAVVGDPPAIGACFPPLHGALSAGRGVGS